MPRKLRAFAIRMQVLLAIRPRKDQIEAAVKDLLFAEGSKVTAIISMTTKQGPRDANYTSNKETKSFIEREAAKIQPGFKRASGTRYLLNRWREEQIAAGRTITYRDLVLQAIALNKSKCGPLRLEHGRYMNFISDFMADNQGAAHREAVSAWHEVKRMDAPKTYAAWLQRAGARRADAKMRNRAVHPTDYR